MSERSEGGRGEGLGPEVPGALPPSDVTRVSGLDLIAGDAQTPPNDRRIRWLRASDGLSVAELYGFQIANASKFTGMYVDAKSPDGTYAEVRLSGQGGADGSALFFVQHLRGSDPGTRLWMSLDAQAGGANPVTRTLMDAGGQSSFPQLWAGGVPAVDQVRMNAGSGRVEFDGTSQWSLDATVAHGLGVLPLAVLLTVELPVGLDVMPLAISTKEGFLDATNFVAVAGTVDNSIPAATNVDFGWVAFAV